MAAAVKLRGHHLLCMLPYIGRGYTERFTQNFDALVERLNHGASIKIVAGMDDVCAALHCGDNGDYKDAEHCKRERALERDKTALQDVGAALGRELKSGEVLAFTPEITAILREKFANGSLRQACNGCEWFGICSGIAACGFAGVKLHPYKD